MTQEQKQEQSLTSLFRASEVVDAGVPKYALGGAAFDNNRVPGFAVGDAFGRSFQEAPYDTEESVTPMMEGGRRRRRTRKQKQKQKQQQRGGRKPRLQLTLRATVRLRSRSRSRSRRMKQRQ